MGKVIAAALIELIDISVDEVLLNGKKIAKRKRRGVFLKIFWHLGWRCLNFFWLSVVTVLSKVFLSLVLSLGVSVFFFPFYCCCCHRCFYFSLALLIIRKSCVFFFSSIHWNFWRTVLGFFFFISHFSFSFRAFFSSVIFKGAIDLSFYAFNKTVVLGNVSWLELFDYLVMFWKEE